MFSLLPISGDLVLIIKKGSRHLCFIAQKTEGQALPLNVYYHDSSGMSTMFFAFFSFLIFFCLAAALLHAPTGIRTRSVPFGNPTVLSRQPVPFGYERLSALGGIRTLKPPVLSRIHIPFWYKGMYSWRSSNLQVKRRHPDLNRDISMRITHGLANRCLTIRLKVPFGGHGRT